MKRFVLFLTLVLLFTAGCYRNKLVESNQVGLQMDDGVSVNAVVGPGRYSNAGWWADMVTINASNITIAWNDPSMVTRDKQPIGMTLAVTFARKRDSDSIKDLYTQYNAEAKDDTALQTLVASKIPGVAKGITTKYTLDEMLGISDNISSTADIGRDVVTQEVFDALKKELDKVDIQLTSVGISDIAASKSFMDALDAKAKAQIDIQVAQQQTKLITEQLAQEKATTQIELEKANRANQVNQVTAQAYNDSPQLFELRKLELLQGIIGQGDTIVYVPEGTDITSVLTQGTNVVPTK